MKNLLAFLLLLTLARPALADSPSAAAQAAAEAWLKLTDAGNFATAYDQAASPMKAATTRQNFQTMFQQARTPFGAVKSRTLKSATPTNSLPGAPPGQYVVMQYSTAFAARPSAIETITPMLDKDGKWHVSGYYIK